VCVCVGVCVCVLLCATRSCLIYLTHLSVIFRLVITQGAIAGAKRNFVFVFINLIRHSVRPLTRSWNVLRAPLQYNAACTPDTM